MTTSRTQARKKTAWLANSEAASAKRSKRLCRRRATGIRQLKLVSGSGMLELRANCEWCDKDLPPGATDARICTYECTFCAECVEQVLHNVCPNCGGGFVRRPIRPMTERRPGVCLEKQPASSKRVHLKWTRDEVAEFARNTQDVAPADR